MNEAKNFLDDSGNAAAIKLLISRIKELDTVQGEYPLRDRERMIEFSARRKAIKIIEDWIEELFQIKKGQWSELYSKEEEFIEHDSG